MSKAKKKQTSNSKVSKPKVTSSPENNHKYYQWIVFAFAFLIYANTLTHDYT